MKTSVLVWQTEYAEIPITDEWLELLESIDPRWRQIARDKRFKRKRDAVLGVLDDLQVHYLRWSAERSMAILTGIENARP